MSAREVALDVLTRYEAGSVYLRDCLEEAYRQTPSLSNRDKAFCRDLVYGTVRRLNTLDWALNRLAASTVDKLSVAVRGVLRLGAYQILYMQDRVPAYAAVNESVEVAKKYTRPGVVSFVNGVLRSLERESDALPWPREESDPVSALSLKYSHPAWLVRRWLDRWGRDECVALLRKNNEPPPLSVRVNTLVETRAGLFKSLLEEGVEVEVSRLSLSGLRLTSFPSLADLSAFQKGAFMVQDDSSQLVTDVLDPQPGETVADLCAAPGGKTTHIAERLKNHGAVLAFDTHAHRLSLLTQNCARLGIGNVQPFLMDAREAGKKYMGSADRVLVDAPCSGLGVIRRRPDIRWNKDFRGVEATFPSLQLEILRSAALCVKTGGVLVYSTCTLEPEENEKVVEKFLSGSPHFRIESPLPYLPPALASTLIPDGYVRLFPHRHDTDGFFVTRLRRLA